jgi:7-cyano-7-deazaguanine synthase
MTGLSSEGALVAFSGGQDSATCLAWALERFERVETIGFEYGQAHNIEMAVREQLRKSLQDIRPKWAPRLRDDHVLDARVIGRVGESALTGGAESRWRNLHLPATFVPGRNLAFLTLAAALAYRRDLKHIVIGVCETDFSGYPDCRDATIRALQTAINLGMESDFTIHTPLMWINKASTWELAEKLGGREFVEIVRRQTHTCYAGDRDHWHEWGFGCGQCSACQLRANGWHEYSAAHVAA